MKLICLPHSGASSLVFYKWLKYAPKDCQLVALDYPAHGTRADEALIWNYASLVENMYVTYQEEFNEPFVLFGHSVGALVAFGLAERLEKNKNNSLQQLLVSGREAPHARDDLPDIGHLDDPEFVRILQERYGELPAPILEDPDLYKQFIPLLKAGFTISEKYVHQEQPPLRTPMSVFVPEKDTTFSYEEAQEWKKCSQSFMKVKKIPGDHLSCMSDPIAIQEIMKSIC